MLASPLRYGTAAALVLLGLVWLADKGSRLGLGPALLLLPLVALPAWGALAYGAAVGRAHALSIWEDAPWWARMGPRFWGALIAGLAVALGAAASVGLALVGEGWWAWARLLLAALLLYPTAWALARRMGGRRPFARLRPVLAWAPILVGGTVGLLGLAFARPLGGSLAEQVGAEPRYEGASALVAAAVDGLALLDGTRAWAEGRLAEVGSGGATVAAAWRLAGALAEGWLAALPFTALLLPGAEAARILAPTDADGVPGPGRARVALVAGLLTVLMLALAQGLARAESAVASASRPRALAEAPQAPAPAHSDAGPGLPVDRGAAPHLPAPAPLTPAAIRAAVEAERLGDLLCPRGTLLGIEAVERDADRLLVAHRAEMEGAARAGFDAVRARVPAFLDGYYALSAEYLRTLNLLAGDASGYLEEELRDALDLEGALAPLQAAADALRADERLAVLAERREGLLRACALLPSDGQAPVVVSGLSREAFDDLASPRIVFEARLAAGLGGGVAGAIGGAVVAKLLAKEAFGLAAEALAKLAVGKAAGGIGGAAAGAVVGAAGGSVVPGLGTTVGAVVGGIVGGLTIGIATDAALLELEEAVSRAGFEAEILAAIDAAEAEVLAALALP